MKTEKVSASGAPRDADVGSTEIMFRAQSSERTQRAGSHSVQFTPDEEPAVSIGQGCVSIRPGSDAVHKRKICYSHRDSNSEP